MLITVLGITIVTRSNPQKSKSHFSNHYKPGSLLEVIILEKLKKNDFYSSYIGEVIRTDRFKTSGKILIRIKNKDSLEDLRFDSKLLTVHKPEGFKKPLNPGGFDFKEYTKRKGILFQLTLAKDQFFRSKVEKLGIRSRALMIREDIVESLRKQDFSSQELMIIEA